METPMLSASQEQGPSCPDTASVCNGTIAQQQRCFNDGLCCFTSSGDQIHTFCACPQGFDGSMCEARMEEFLEVLESRKSAIQMINLSVGISIFVGVIVLIALGTITFLIVRSSRRRRPWIFEPIENEPDLDKTIVYVQEEISKLSTVQQLNKLSRLSKMFEKTVREAILSEPGHRIERTKSVVMNEYLPRWSSAPMSINRPPNDMDMLDGDDEVFQKRKLQQVFSLQ